MLGLNTSIIYMFLIVVVTYWLLNLLFIKRLTTAVVERFNRTAGRNAEIAELKIKLESLRLKLETEINHAKKDALHVFDLMRKEATDEYKKVVARARERANKEIQESREAIEQKYIQEIGSIQGQVPGLVAFVIEKILKQGFSATHRADEVRV